MNGHIRRLARQIPKRYVHSTNHPQHWPHGPIRHTLVYTLSIHWILTHQHGLEAINNHLGVVAK